MKKHISLLLVLVCLLSLCGCGNRGEKHTIEILIPAGSTESFVYSDVEVRPTGRKITLSAGAGISDTEVILKPVNDSLEPGYVAEYLTRGMPVEFDIAGVTDEWFKIGVSIQNDSDQNDSDKGPIAVAVVVEGVEIRDVETTAPTGYPSGSIQQPQIMYDGLPYFYFATGFDEPLPEGYEYVGDVEEVDNENAPQYDLQGSRVELRQEIYVLPGIHDTIYVKYENGYARFTLKKGTENQLESDAAVIPTCKSIEEAIADDFIDPSTVSVLSGEWAYTVDPNRFVALVTVNYMNKFNEYETAEYVVVGTFGGDAGTRYCLNQHSPYTRENVLQVFGAIEGKQFALFQDVHMTLDNG